MDTSKPGKGPKKRPKDASSGHSEEDRGRRIPMNDEGWEKNKKKRKTKVPGHEGGLKSPGRCKFGWYRWSVKPTGVREQLWGSLLGLLGGL